MLKLLKFSINNLKNSMLYKNRYLSQNFSKPVIICLITTTRCNFRCEQCKSWTLPSNEISTAQWKKIVLRLRRWIGPFYLNISGGEPFLRKDTTELIKFSNSLGIVTDLITNGSLIDYKMAEKIVDSRLDKITFSLDGASPKTHDILRNFKGAFNRVVRAMKNLRILSSDLNISVNTTIMSENLDELKSIVDLAVENNINGVYFRGLICKGYNYYNNDSYSENTLWPRDYGKVCRFIDGLIRLKSSGFPILNSINNLRYLKEYFKNPYFEFKHLTCFKPRHALTIRCDGQAKICEKLIGSVLEHEPQHLWSSPQALAIREQKMNCKAGCILKDHGNLEDSLGDQFRVFYGGFKKKWPLSYLKVRNTPKTA